MSTRTFNSFDMLLRRMVRQVYISIFVACMVGLLILPFLSSAQESSNELQLTPVVIDEKAKPRDILKKTLVIQNSSNRKLNLYPSVNDVNAEEGAQDFAPANNGEERGASLANWIELSRGVVEIGPGEEKSIPFVIRVNLNATPGAYHAVISFAEGSTRDAAEAGEPLAKLMVNVDIERDVKEILQLNKFFTDSIFFSGDDVLFNYQLENIGNQQLQPKGDIRIYDRKGKEVATIAVNKDNKAFAPDQMAQLASVWTAAQGLGRYKALLNVEFGDSQKASVQDTVFFWIIPWQQLLALLITSMLAVGFLALHVHRVIDARHAKKYAMAAAASGIVVPQTAPEPRSEKSRSWNPLRLFRRNASTALDEVPMAETTPTVREVPASTIPDREPARQTSRPESGAINLKDMHTAHTTPEKRPGHVINLKG